MCVGIPCARKTGSCGGCNPELSYQIEQKKDWCAQGRGDCCIGPDQLGVAALYVGRRGGCSKIVVGPFECDRFDLHTVFDPILPTMIRRGLWF